MHGEKCPVCLGNGLVPNGFYRQTSSSWSSTSTVPEICKGCNGKGWVEVSDEIKFDTETKDWKIFCDGTGVYSNINDVSLEGHGKLIENNW